MNDVSGPTGGDRGIRESRRRQNLLDSDSPEGLQVLQITTDPHLISHHMYPESHMFTADSRKFIFHRMGVEGDAGGEYWLCDIEDGFSVRRITEAGETRGGVAISPDGNGCITWPARCRSPALRPERGDALRSGASRWRI